LAVTETPQPSPRRIHAIVGWRRLLLWPLGLLVRLWCRTVRIEADEATRRVMGRLDQAAIFTLWHNRLFIAAELYRRFRKGKRLYALVSASKDGAWLAAFFEVVGLRTVRGSSSRLAARQCTPWPRSSATVKTSASRPTGRGALATT